MGSGNEQFWRLCRRDRIRISSKKSHRLMQYQNLLELLIAVQLIILHPYTTDGGRQSCIGDEDHSAFPRAPNGEDDQCPCDLLISKKNVAPRADRMSCQLLISTKLRGEGAWPFGPVLPFSGNQNCHISPIIQSYQTSLSQPHKPPTPRPFGTRTS